MNNELNVMTRLALAWIVGGASGAIAATYSTAAVTTLLGGPVLKPSTGDTGDAVLPSILLVVIVVQVVIPALVWFVSYCVASGVVHFLVLRSFKQRHWVFLMLAVVLV